MSYLYFTDATGATLTLRQETERDDCIRYSARILETGEFPICSALSEDYEQELAALIASRGWVSASRPD